MSKFSTVQCMRHEMLKNWHATATTVWPCEWIEKGWVRLGAKRVFNGRHDDPSSSSSA